MPSTGLATWYFHPGVGVDSPGNGSIGSPCNTLGYAVNTLASPGDTVLGYGGSTSAENAALVNPTPASPITIGSYGTGQVTIAGGAGAAISVTDGDGFVINNVAATGATAAFAANPPTGIIQFVATTAASHVNGIAITNCTITGAGQVGILIYADPNTASNYSNITITGNSVSGMVQAGILLVGEGSANPGTQFSAVTIGARPRRTSSTISSARPAPRSTRSRATGSWSAGPTRRSDPS